MANARCHTICWMPICNNHREGLALEHLLLAEGMAEGVVLAFDEEHGLFRLTFGWVPDQTIAQASRYAARFISA